MAHEIAKLLLEHAETFIERTQAVRTAMDLGMPLHDIEEYLDWLDSLRATIERELSDERTPPTADPSQPEHRLPLPENQTPPSEPRSPTG